MKKKTANLDKCRLDDPFDFDSVKHFRSMFDVNKSTC